MGHSMGGHVTGVAIEQWPDSFDGALPMCGVMGDNELFDFYQDAYLLAEYLAGNTPAVPTPADYFTVRLAGHPAAARAAVPGRAHARRASATRRRSSNCRAASARSSSRAGWAPTAARSCSTSESP